MDKGLTDPIAPGPTDLETTEKAASDEGRGHARGSAVAEWTTPGLSQTDQGSDLPAPDLHDPAQRSGSGVRWALGTALWPWVLSRLLVLGALAVAHEISNGAHPSAAVVVRVRQGLLGWDAGWYESIARHGYWGAGHDSLRFFPLVPALSRGLGSVPGVGIGAALVIVSNLSALAGIAWLAALARRETGDAAFARRAAWLVYLAPPAFTMVMGYAEATLLMLSVGAFWALREQRWMAAAVLGLLAAMCRPFGVLLFVPAFVEAVRGWGATGGSERVRRAAAVVAPALGFGAFIGWVGWRYGDALAPLKIQEQGGHRGAITEPFKTLAHDASLLVQGKHLGTALHLPWVLLALALLVVAARWLPASYSLYAGAVLAVSLTTSNLDGFERYALSAFPLVLAGAALTKSGRSERAVLVLAGAGMVGYAVLAFTNLYVP
ncbi:MAG: hypothetical protein ACRDV4_05165 [Acidimicrobiales bacterium]